MADSKPYVKWGQARIKITPARWRVVGLSPGQMTEIATKLQLSITRRILTGTNVADMGARCLSFRKVKGRWSYSYAKGVRHPPAIRNWRYTGFTLRHLHVLKAGVNSAVIGFIDALHPAQKRRKVLTTNDIVSINQGYEPMFGVSPHDRMALALESSKYRKVTIEAGSSAPYHSPTTGETRWNR